MNIHGYEAINKTANNFKNEVGLDKLKDYKKFHAIFKTATAFTSFITCAAIVASPFVAGLIVPTLTGTGALFVFTGVFSIGVVVMTVLLAARMIIDKKSGYKYSQYDALLKFEEIASHQKDNQRISINKKNLQISGEHQLRNLFNTFAFRNSEIKKNCNKFFDTYFTPPKIGFTVDFKEFDDVVNYLNE